MPLAAVAWRGLAAPPVSLSQCLLRLLTAPSPLCALAAGRSGGALLLPLSALVALKHMHSSLIRFVLEPSSGPPALLTRLRSLLARWRVWRYIVFMHTLSLAILQLSATNIC